MRSCPAWLLLPIGLALSAAPAWSRPCPASVQAELLAAPAEGREQVDLACSPALGPGDVILKRVVIEGSRASGIVLDCRGGTIGSLAAPVDFPNSLVEIRSRVRRTGDGVSWDRPAGVTIRNCTLRGPVRIWGMAPNGQGEALRESSRRPGHTERAQAAAPTRIRIENSRLHASGGTPLYLAPGVTEVTVEGNRFSGTSRSIALYLDAESARNVIRKNQFEIDTGREVVAVDGSAQNRIEENEFIVDRQGGIFLYRNCGEGGTVRHQTPSFNTIAANVFRYTYFPHLPSISVGARGGWGSYCEDDAGYPFGSSLDNGDDATGNEVAGNSVLEGWGTRAKAPRPKDTETSP